MLICRVQLPEDTVLPQVTATTTSAQNPTATVIVPDTGNTGDTPQDSATTVPATRPPTVDGSPGAVDPPRSGLIVYLIHHVWNDPHLRICELYHRNPRPQSSRLTVKPGFTLSFFLTVVNQLVMLFSLPLLATAVTYSMFWLPQIIRSAIIGRNSALTTEYLVGTTICRLLFAFCLCSAKSYFFGLTSIHSDYLGYSENIMEISPRRRCHFPTSFSILWLTVP